MSCFVLPFVRPIFKLVDVQLLENEFVNGYCEGDRVQYVFIMDEKWKEKEVIQSEYGSWHEQWRTVNDFYKLFFYHG